PQLAPGRGAGRRDDGQQGDHRDHDTDGESAMTHRASSRRTVSPDPEAAPAPRQAPRLPRRATPQTAEPSWIAAASLPGTRRPSPAAALSFPLSTATLPRRTTTAGQPCTSQPSHALEADPWSP